MSETAKIKNLWGDLPVDTDIRTPYIVLKEQASLLSEATNGLLVGSVNRTSLDKSIYLYKEYDCECNLEIKVPSLNNYSISIVKVSYPINIYPSKISSQATKDITTSKLSDRRRT